jgi:SAM-dependent methyltransferase
MAYHWVPRKWEAAKAMARALRPDGVVAILMSGRGGEQAYRDVISNIEPINYRWLGAFDGNLRGPEEMEDYLVQAGLEPIDIWMETRVRHTTVEAYMERMRVVAGHMIGDQSEAEVADYVAKIEAGLRARSGPRGWRYEFAKLFAIARKPG